MAKILCAISGIEFKCEHVPMMLTSREAKHPIFHLPQKKLLGLYGKWTQGGLTDTDSYLLYLALFNSTELCTFAVPASTGPRTISIVSGNMPRLVDICTKISALNRPSLTMAKICINQETKHLDTSHIWIEIWYQNLKDYVSGYRAEMLSEKIKKREDILQKLIKDSSKHPEQYAGILAKWAADAGDFPLFNINNPITGKDCTLREYWIEIIKMCYRDEKIFQIPKADIDELIEHCEQYIPHGTIYTFTLMELLKAGYHKKKNFLGLGDIDISISNYRIISTETTVEDANKMAMIDSAPSAVPIATNYPSKLAYLRAKAKWDMKLAYEQQQKKEDSVLALVGVNI